MLSVLCFYIPAHHGAQRNKQSDESGCGGARGRTPRIFADARSRFRAAAMLHRDSRPQARDQQRQHAPAQPHQRRSQMGRGSERYTQPAADREISSNAHGALRHQRQRHAGQRPRCRSARSARRPPLGRGVNRSWPCRRGGNSPARTDGLRSPVVCHSRCHACASSWQQAAAVGLSSY